MAMHPRPQPARLHIPPHLAQGPLDAPAMFSPGLPTAIHQGFPGWAHSAMQTPMQGGFLPGPMTARPHMHRARSSVAHLANAGIFPPAGMPLTPGAVPLTPLGPGIPAMGGPMFPHPGPGGFIPKSRRTMSIGGPPKAVLGGPNKQQAPPPPAPAPPPTKQKKVVLNLPKETIPGEDGAPSTRAEYAREPLVDIPEQVETAAPELTSANEINGDEWRYSLPDTVEVYLPGKKAWDKIKHQIIEEKLEKLGVERGSGINVPQIHAPHARAASVSSPADPALLLFRLNKLHASQNVSPNTSLTTSPQPPLSLSISPNNAAPRFQNGRHGYSMSLAQPPSYSPANQFNPFGPNATLGSDQVLPVPEIAASSPGVIHTPQARVPIVASSLAPPLGSRPVSRPDFARGFGLDIPEEDEEAEAVVETEERVTEAQVSKDAVALMPPHENVAPLEEVPAEYRDSLTDIAEDDEGGVMTASHSRAHSRHVSRLSAALSLREVGGPHGALVRAPRSSDGEGEVDNIDDEEVIAEWTGSEDLRDEAESSADESIGEWSNPSDEERARQQRAQRRAIRRARQERPRRLPNFPQPPEEAHYQDDDVISNPSDEERPLRPAQFLQANHYSPGYGRPLPPLPHSRATSANYSYHDPALAHSRQPSEQIPYPASGSGPASLNPDARPFAFGRQRLSGSFASGTFGELPATMSHSAGHSRESSVPKTLNISAPPFTPGGINPNAPVFTPSGFNLGAAPFTPVGLKPTAPAFTPLVLKADAPVFTPGGFNVNASAFTPGGFTFKPPTGVPQLSFPSPQANRPLPTPPETVGPARASQGREKRQRRNSETMVGLDADSEDMLEDTMASFKFPSPQQSRHMPRRSGSEPTSPTAGHSRHGSAIASGIKPFASSSLGASWPRDSAVSEPAPSVDTVHSPLVQDVVNLNSDDEPAPDGAHIPYHVKPKRTPLPLDFTHPVSTKTVPAGLFKALNSSSTEDVSRRAVRSRLNTGDPFEHSPRPSLDDSNVVPISFSRKPARMVTDPILLSQAQDQDGLDRTIARLRAASMPGVEHSPTSSVSEVSIPSIQFADRSAMRGFEQRLEDLLETKMGALREDLLEQNHTFGDARISNASNEAAITEIVALVHSKLQDSVVKALENGHANSNNKPNFELIRDIVEQGHEASRALIKGDLSEVLKRLNAQPTIAPSASTAVLEAVSNKTISAIVQSTATLTERLNALQTTHAQVDRASIVADVVANLAPHFAALHTEPVDYDGLTNKLSQAVKPHIAQLIDLASDKRETAGLIVEQLKPMLAAIVQPHVPLDTNTLVAQLTAEVRRVVAPVDAHEIKEQVSDLVVERLDSRLAVRDRSFNVDTVVTRVIESIGSVMEPVRTVAAVVERMSSEQQTLSADTRDLATSNAQISAIAKDLPGQLSAIAEAFKAVQVDLQSKVGQGNDNDVAVKSISEVTSVVKEMQGEQHNLADQMSELANLQQDVIGGLNALPEVLVATTKVLDEAHEDMMTRERSYQRDLDEVRHILGQNAELQANLAKARSQHGQVRVEKDMINERLIAAEAERDRLRAQAEEAQASSASQSTKLAAVEAKNQELERALVALQERFKESDAASKAQADRLHAFDEERKSWSSERDQLNSRVKELDLRAELMQRNKENAESMNTVLRNENDRLIADSAKFDSIAEQLQSIQVLQSEIQKNESAELRRAKEKTENEFAALQKRFKEQEARITNSERTAYTARQTLAQAQQRASEWEKKAQQYDNDRIALRTRAEEAESSRTQLEAELTDAQSRLEEKDAHDRLTRDRESKLRDQVALLEGQLAKLKVTASKPTGTPTLNGHSSHVNDRGVVAPEPRGRAVSPSDTIYGRSRSTTPVRGAPVMEREGSVQDSRHAPKNRYPSTLSVTPVRPSAYQAPNSYQSRRTPSPAASVVSVAPTLGEDGWWE